jgi:hypothetical protein
LLSQGLLHLCCKLPKHCTHFPLYCFPISRNQHPQKVLSSLRYTKCTGSHMSAKVSLPCFFYSRKIKHMKDMFVS